MNIIDSLKAEIAKKRDELEKLEAALQALSGDAKPSKKAKPDSPKKGRRAFTPEQKAAAAERMRAYHAAKRAQSA